MSNKFKKTIKDGMIIYENEQARIIFSSNVPPHRTEKLIAMTGVSKEPAPEGFRNVPVTIIWSESHFRQMIEDLNLNSVYEVNSME